MLDLLVPHFFVQLSQIGSACAAVAHTDRVVPALRGDWSTLHRAILAEDPSTRPAVVPGHLAGEGSLAVTALMNLHIRLPVGWLGSVYDHILRVAHSPSHILCCRLNHFGHIACSDLLRVGRASVLFGGTVCTPLGRGNFLRCLL